MQWEVPALAILMELRSRAVLEGIPSATRQRLYAEAGARLEARALRKGGRYRWAAAAPFRRARFSRPRAALR